MVTLKIKKVPKKFYNKMEIMSTKKNYKCICIYKKIINNENENTIVIKQ